MDIQNYLTSNKAFKYEIGDKFIRDGKGVAKPHLKIKDRVYFLMNGNKSISSTKVSRATSDEDKKTYIIIRLNTKEIYPSIAVHATSFCNILSPNQ